MAEKSSKNSKKKQSNELPNLTPEFLQDNEKLSKIISKSKKKKGGPYSKTAREARRNEVARLYFDYGYSATKISELMKVNRNTINDDIRLIYKQTENYWDGPRILILAMSQIEKLELLKTRLREYLDETKNLQERLSIEKMILDVDSKIGHLELKLYNSKEMSDKSKAETLNAWLKEHNHRERYLTYDEMKRVPEKAYGKILQIIKNSSQ